MTNPRDIIRVTQNMVNTPSADKMWPVLSYQSASRHWITARSDANKKLRKLLHDRRCGYLGCMDRAVNIKSIYEWCEQMEWLYLKGHKIPENYRAFEEIISRFLSKMNHGAASEITYNPILGKILYEENGTVMELEDLSAGYQSILNLVIDLAYRMAILNPDADGDIRMAEGIVLIDEIDSNLHLKWQWEIIEALTGTFPKIQFIAATHSPIIVSSCKNANIINVSGTGDIQYITDSYAFSVNEIFKSMLGNRVRPEIVENLTDAFESAMDRDQYNIAKENL